ncbi:hypothetical protein EX30DRAFT_392646 [Ascodesmis nigricans]|uniref:N-acetyltransferase ECO1 n=1 Tax=Ascodesmis nigricans TaxID=341454 RepID=A0A4V3SJU1_9PEZI|nr:hypothetical protein EX30DRAFT_392646 [Ascodesmis nigricans]
MTLGHQERSASRTFRSYTGNSKVTKTYKRSAVSPSIPNRVQTKSTSEASFQSAATFASSEQPDVPQSFAAAALRRRRLTRKPPPATNKPRVPVSTLTQLTLDLGQTIRTTCKGCGMSFCPSISIDATLHARFHAQHVGGIDFPGVVSKPLWETNGTPHAFITMVDARSSTCDRRKAHEALKVVEIEIGAANLTEDSLWGSTKDGDARFKVFLYVEQQFGSKIKHTYKVVGIILAERIRHAYRLPNSQGPSLDVELTGQKVEALMGIARVWTCVDARRRGIARRLIAEARRGFIYGMTIAKDQVAFSQPTASGSKLAGAVLGDDSGGGWLVYKEEV